VLTADEARLPALVLGGALSANRALFDQVREARVTEDGVVLVLRSGTEIRLGAAEELGLQLAVAQARPRRRRARRRVRGRQRPRASGRRLSLKLSGRGLD
jgi:hypothetical protein